MLSAQLPHLRKDLSFHQAPSEADGAPAWTVFDPVNNSYLRIGWREKIIFENMGLRFRANLQELHKYLSECTTIRITEDDLKLVVTSAVSAGITNQHQVRPALVLLDEQRRVESKKWSRGIFSTLFFRIPLIHPQRFLTRTVSAVRWMWSPAMLILYAAVWCVSLLLTINRWDSFLATFPQFFTSKGIATYAVIMACIKAVHEFSHAYIATSFGVRVPVMGIAFYMFCPIPYCNVTDAWRLSSRKKRLAISLAGVGAELAIGGIAMLCWHFSEDVFMRSICFVISTAVILSTLLINLNPAMRYDGYYVLSDLWHVDNLQPRGFAWAKWWFRRLWSGWPIPVPQEGLPKRHTIFLALYGLGVWIYRLGFYTGIALLLYTYFRPAKLAAAVIFCISTTMFLVMPLVREIVQMKQFAETYGRSARLLVLSVFLISGLIWLFCFSPARISIAAYTEPDSFQVVSVPYPGVLMTSPLRRGQEVKTDQILATVDVSILDRDLAINQQDILRCQWQVDHTETSNKKSAERERARLELSRAEAVRESLLGRKAQTVIRASMDGCILEADPYLSKGISIPGHATLAVVAAQSSQLITGFLPESAVSGVNESDGCLFYPKGQEPVACTVKRISPVREQTLDYAPLASVYGGSIPVTQEKSKRLLIHGTFYRIELVPKHPIAAGITGTVWLTLSTRSRLNLFWDRITSTLYHESGF